MSVARAGTVVLVVTLAVLVAGLALVEPSSWLVVLALFVGGTGLGQLVVAALLASGALKPTLPGWGASAFGQLLLGAASLCMAALVWAGHSIPAAVGWSGAAIYLTLILLGYLVERQAHGRHSTD